MTFLLSLVTRLRFGGRESSEITLSRDRDLVRDTIHNSFVIRLI